MNESYRNNLEEALFVTCVLLNEPNLEAPQQETVIKEQKRLKVVEGPRSAWTKTNCETKLGKMSSISSMFTFSRFIFVKGLLLEAQWSHRGRGRIGSLPPGSSEKLPVCCRHSALFWHALTLRMRSFFGNYRRARSSWGARRCALQISFLWNEKLNLPWSHISRCHQSAKDLFYLFHDWAS